MMPTKQRKLVEIDKSVLLALYELSRTSGDRLDDLFDEALRGLLRKRGQPISLAEALKMSARVSPANDATPRKKRAPATKKQKR